MIKELYRKDRCSRSWGGKVFNYLRTALIRRWMGRWVWLTLSLRFCFAIWRLQTLCILKHTYFIPTHLPKIAWVTGAICSWAGKADSPSTAVVEHTTSRPHLKVFRYFHSAAWKVHLLLCNGDKGLHIFWLGGTSQTYQEVFIKKTTCIHGKGNKVQFDIQPPWKVKGWVKK